REGVEVNEWIPVTNYQTPKGMVASLLGKNYKTAKKDLAFEENTSVKGLSLLPAKSLGRREIDGRVIAAEQGFEKVNACVGASAACIASCLVYSGHNTIDPYNAIVKAARFRALRHQPQAFLRVLSESIKRHTRIRDAVPYVRLNVFSDLPWELICPEIFTKNPDTRFYDYTKVVNRSLDLTPNYDLTFSFSGENKAQVAFELNRGRRVAVVFIPPYRAHAEGRKRGEGLPDQIDTDELFGTQFGEPLEVVDGDVSDVRPRDPGRVIVGLRWKVPMGRQEKAFAQAQEAAFAVPVEDYGGVLIAATSARQEPIVDDDEGDDDYDDGEE
ncbi:MAG: GP88 family protein, partial [Tepidisphaeraceae bacterium]